MSILKNFKILILAILMAAPIRAAMNLGLAKEDGGQAGTFLNFAASARSLGMGKAHTAVADDASAPYWNPAGLAQIERKDIVALYSSMQLETNYGFFSYAQPAANYGTFSLGLVSLRSANFDKATLNPDKTFTKMGTFDINETAVLLSHGIRFAPKWSVGETVKVIREEIDRYNGTGAGLDAGLMWALSQKWQAGFSIKNIVAPRLKLKSTEDVYPRELRLGLKWQPREKLILASDVSKLENAQSKISLGAEWQAYKNLYLRGGVNDTELTTGLGFQFGDWGVDYAFGFNVAAPDGTESYGQSHRFGIHLQFGRNITAEEETLTWQKKGQEVLAQLRNQMNSKKAPDPIEIAGLLIEARRAIQHRGFPDARDLYLVQGYVYFFEKKYDKSTENLGEAISLTRTKNEELENHFMQAKMRLSEAESQTLVNSELKKAKEAFDKADYKACSASSQKILKINPDQIEAKNYFEIANRRVQEPVFMAMNIAKAKMEKGQYLEALKTLSDLQKIDPQNPSTARLIEQCIKSLETNQHNDGTRYVIEVTPDQNKSREFYSQGLLLYSKGDLKGAVKAWETSLKLNNNNQSARNAYNRVLMELKDINQ